MAPRNPFHERGLKKDIGRIGSAGRASERRVAKEIGGKLTAASGAHPLSKGDIKKGSFLIEAKSTQNASLGLKYEYAVKIGKEARGTGKHPAIAINFTDDEGRSKLYGDWVAIPLSLFKELVDGS